LQSQLIEILNHFLLHEQFLLILKVLNLWL